MLDARVQLVPVANDVLHLHMRYIKLRHHIVFQLKEPSFTRHQQVVQSAVTWCSSMHDVCRAAARKAAHCFLGPVAGRIGIVLLQLFVGALSSTYCVHQLLVMLVCPTEPEEPKVSHRQEGSVELHSCCRSLRFV